ncbi:MYB31 transcription factor31 [Zea mays]|uniref:MYB31 transcription factor31 n=1 Tax=Zea mays TaxID=4577 RepID=A0A1D6EU05_MAIZE|nr:MYB31 transcription factor31 [Zea mays]
MEGVGELYMQAYMGHVGRQGKQRASWNKCHSCLCLPSRGDGDFARDFPEETTANPYPPLLPLPSFSFPPTKNSPACTTSVWLRKWKVELMHITNTTSQLQTISLPSSCLTSYFLEPVPTI